MEMSRAVRNQLQQLPSLHGTEIKIVTKCALWLTNFKHSLGLYYSIELMTR